MILLLMVLMSFGALSMDVSLMRLGQSQAQDLADAAAHAAVVVLKQGGTETEARTAAEEVIASNTIVGLTPQLIELNFGSWDSDSQTFTEGTGSGAVRVQLGLVGNNALPLLMGPVLGWNKVEVRGQATAATKRLQVLLVMDTTGSWHQKNFKNARNAAVAFLDVLHGNHGDEDMVGMTVFHQRFGWEYTPFTLVADSAANLNLIRDDWAALNISSYAGDYQPTWTTGSYINSKYVACKVYGSKGDGGSPWGQWQGIRMSGRASTERILVREGSLWERGLST
jgi:Flp pilus assembly protein TadG